MNARQLCEGRDSEPNLALTIGITLIPSSIFRGVLISFSSDTPENRILKFFKAF